MIVAPLYRNLIIPAFETLYKRRSTLKYWRELEASQWRSPDELQAQQARGLRALLAHAAARSPYYARLWSERGVDVRSVLGPAELVRLPLLDKSQIRAHRAELRATGASRLITKTTGGSTGEPLQFDLDQGSHERRCAAMHRGYGWAGAAPGAKTFHLWGAPLDERPAWKRWKDRGYDALLRRQMVNSFTLSETTAPEILQQLRRARPDVIVAYTGAIDSLARLADEQGLRPYSPRSIIVGAEKLHAFQRERIEAVFQAPVFETYGSREFMLVGAECAEHRGLHLTAENLVVEITDDDGRPTPEGRTGNVVVTDLTNYGMPLIRYVTGDQATAGFARCRCGRGLPLLSEVRGRRVDTLRTPDGRSVPGEFFPHLMKDFSAVRQFQVVQPSLDRLELHVVLASHWTEADRGRLVERVRRTLGEQVAIDWRPVDAIPLTRAGKHRVVVSHVGQTGA